jgi:hypothetical protein
MSEPGVRLAGTVCADQAAIGETGQVAAPLLVGAIDEDGNRVRPQVRVDGEQQALVLGAVAEPLHDGQQVLSVRPRPPCSCGNRHPHHAELRATFPAFVAEPLVAFARDHVVAVER